MFKFKTSLQQIEFQSLSQNPLLCSCIGSGFLNALCGHIVRSDLNIVRNDKLRDLLCTDLKYRESVSFSLHQDFDIIMDACEAYARRWTEKEDVELVTLSEWIKSFGDVLKRRIRRLNHSVNTRHESIFSDPDVVKELSRVHEIFVIAPADKASSNYTLCLQEILRRHPDRGTRLHLLSGNLTYNLTYFSASEVLDNHKSVLISFGIQTNDEEIDLPYIYWFQNINFTYRYIDDVLSINNPDFENYLGQMHLAELEIKDTTENNTSASYLDLLLSIGREGQLCTSLTTNVTISNSISQTFRS